MPSLHKQLCKKITYYKKNIEYVITQPMGIEYITLQRIIKLVIGMRKIVQFRNCLNNCRLQPFKENLNEKWRC